MIRQIEKQYSNIVNITGKMPVEIEMTRKAYEKLVQECLDMKITDFAEILDKDGNPTNKFMGMKITFNEDVNNFKILK